MGWDQIHFIIRIVVKILEAVQHPPEGFNTGRLSVETLLIRGRRLGNRHSCRLKVYINLVYYIIKYN